MIKRTDLIKEEILREYIRKRIHETKQNDPEHKLRMIIRDLVMEAKEAEPTENTGINVLTGVLDRVVTQFKSGYKQLTTSPEQRVSYIKHMLAFIKDSLNIDKQLGDAGDAVEQEELEPELTEAEGVSLSVGDDAEEIAQEDDPFLFPDIDKKEEPAEEEGELLRLADEDDTGRDKAVKVFDNIEKEIVDGYSPLKGIDAELYAKYILKNLDLHRKEAEKELPNPNEELMTVPAEDL
jgi:hypothetical protein